MAFLGWNLSPSYEVTLYTILLLVLWLLIRLVASSMNNLITYFREGSLSVDPFLNDVEYPCSYWTDKGKRPYQEDRFHVLKGQKHESSLYGVFDGHGGSHASQHCRDNMLQSISSDPEFAQDPQQSLMRNFVRYYFAFTKCFVVGFIYNRCRHLAWTRAFRQRHVPNIGMMGVPLSSLSSQTPKYMLPMVRIFRVLQSFRMLKLCCFSW